MNIVCFSVCVAQGARTVWVGLNGAGARQAGPKAGVLAEIPAVLDSFEASTKGPRKTARAAAEPFEPTAA